MIFGAGGWADGWELKVFKKDVAFVLDEPPFYMLRLKEVKLFLVWLDKPTNLVKRSWRWANLTMQHVLQIFEERGGLLSSCHRQTASAEKWTGAGMHQCCQTQTLTFFRSSELSQFVCNRGTRGWLGPKWGATVS